MRSNVTCSCAAAHTSGSSGNPAASPKPAGRNEASPPPSHTRSADRGESDKLTAWL